MRRHFSQRAAANMAVVAGLLVMMHTNALANSTGITGRSGKNGSNCSSCHSGANYNSSLSYNGDTTVTPGTTLDIDLILQFTAPAGVSNPHAGVNVAVSDNGGSLVAGATTTNRNGELVHVQPNAASGGSFTWSFQWVAPQTEGSVTLFACSEAVNRDFSTTGDDSDTACIEQIFTVANPEPEPEPEPETSPTVGDIDNDGRADFAVWREENTTFYTKSSDTLQVVHREIIGNDRYEVPLLGDIDGNGISDLVTWNSQTGLWSITYDDGSADSYTLGESGDYPFLGDRDGDGKDDLIIRRPSEGKWYFLATDSGFAMDEFTFGSQSSDIPVLGYYDDDNIIDFAIWRDGIWYVRHSTDNITRQTTLGEQDDIRVPADYDGDGQTDYAVWRPSNGTWYIQYSSGGSLERTFGKQSTDLPVPADYDGDGKADLAIRRPSLFEFIYSASESGNTVKEVFGKCATDIPALAAWEAKQSLLPTITETPTEDLPVVGDIDNDNRADFAVWRIENFTFFTKSSDSLEIVHREVMGTAVHEVPLIGDIDGNSISDLVTWNAASGIWSVTYDDGATSSFTLGEEGDYPFLADRDGDGRDDFIVRRPAEGMWYFLASASNHSTESFTFGSQSSDIPALGYYDDDDLVDFAIWRDGTFFVRYSTDNAMRRHTLGSDGDIIAPADYDGDGRTDYATWTPASGTWNIDFSGGGSLSRVFGKRSTDIPVPADYDGDGLADIAIRRPSTFEFIYSSSASGSTVKEVFGKRETDIPALAAWQGKQSLLQEVESSDPEPDPEPTDAATYYVENVSDSIVQGRCVACHVSGGVADGSARLIFSSSSESGYQEANQQAIADFLALDGVDAAYLLGKASGGQGHTGGTQLPVGSDEYSALETYLNLLTQNDGDGNAPIVSDLWANTALLTSDQTYRRASILLTGVTPETNMLDAMTDQDEEQMRTSLINMMQGEGFHDFLIRGANDRLLTDKWLERWPDVIDPAFPRFPAATRLQYDMAVESNGEGDDFWLWFEAYRIGFARAPVELIAYIVENDRPYTEVVTADYTMLNRYTNQGFRGNAQFGDDDPISLFKPGQIQGYMLTDDSFESEWEEGFGLNIISEGTNMNWPHSGILNETAWLNRYPSTATNRNRARSRWTYYHFLDFDIEKSAQRTQDEDALMDTNNPTMNNSNCTVCHQTLDPIAGAYQDYGDAGGYRDSWGGMDALPGEYKYAEDSPYEWGDTWYRDMRSPGFEGQEPAQGQDSLQWLGQQIINDPRFARSVVKFWWHSLMGQEPLSAPQESSDSNYQARLAAFTEQSGFINDIATNLSEHWNLKHTLADMILSPWFRAYATQSEELASVDFGSERLLTPEELKAKTENLTGYIWGYYVADWGHNREYNALEDDYNILYGGIDSDGITKRTGDMTSVMSQVAQTHAVEASCPIVIREFNVDVSERLLFTLVNKDTTPDTTAGEQAIRNQIVQLHRQLLGLKLTENSSEVDATYQLFVESRNAKIARGVWGGIWEDGVECNADFDPYETDEQEGWEAGIDEDFTMSAWRVVMIYLMLDYNYLHE